MINVPSQAVTQKITIIKTAIRMSPRIMAGNGPNRNVVQEKPTGAVLTCPVLLFLSVIFDIITVSL